MKEQKQPIRIRIYPLSGSVDATIKDLHPIIGMREVRRAARSIKRARVNRELWQMGAMPHNPLARTCIYYFRGEKRGRCRECCLSDCAWVIGKFINLRHIKVINLQEFKKESE